MALNTTIISDAATGAVSSITKPISEGTTVTATTGESSSTGLFGFLDSVGSKLGNVAGRAVDTISDNWLNDLNESNSDAVKTADVTPVAGGAALSADTTTNQSFVDKYKTPLLIGGGALILLSVVLLARN